MYTVSSFYRFFPIAESKLELVERDLQKRAAELHVQGLLILAAEGINGTIAAERSAVERFESTLNELAASDEWEYKRSESEVQPFRRFKIKIREEIVTSGEQLSGVPSAGKYLTPEQWHQAMLEWDDVVVLDTRNSYETELGVFKGACDPGLVNFQEFSQFVENSQIPKNKKVLMYCTGGIRCEKASTEMVRQGYEEVYQLKGGILRYLEEVKDGLFEGECFVFDHRVAVDESLNPSQTYRLCPHCGNPGKTKISCENCSKEAVVCEGCLPRVGKSTCSKDCAYQLMRKQNRVHAE